MFTEDKTSESHRKRSYIHLHHGGVSIECLSEFRILSDVILFSHSCLDPVAALRKLAISTGLRRIEKACAHACELSEAPLLCCGEQHGP